MLQKMPGMVQMLLIPYFAATSLRKWNRNKVERKAVMEAVAEKV